MSRTGYGGSVFGRVVLGLYQNLYFMSLVGGLAGLLSWLASILLTAVLPVGQYPWVSDLVAATTLGGAIGCMTVGFSDKWDGNRVRARYVFSGLLIGLAAGLIASFLQLPITMKLGVSAPLLSRVIAWMLAGSFIGFGLGLRWVAVNRHRAIHAFAGGLLGGAVGGLLFGAIGTPIPDLSQALGFVLTGVGICFGITLAPILLRDGLLAFISSGDARAQSKFGRTKKEWEIQDGDSYVIGSQSQSLSSTNYRPEVEIYIPDAAIAPRHATLFAKEGRFYIARHPDVASQAGLARYVLRVHGRSVVATAEIRPSDDILIGRTALRFNTQEKGTPAEVRR